MVTKNRFIMKQFELTSLIEIMSISLLFDQTEIMSSGKDLSNWNPI